jgi:hypothetical protein
MRVLAATQALDQLALGLGQRQQIDRPHALLCGTPGVHQADLQQWEDRRAPQPHQWQPDGCPNSSLCAQVLEPPIPSPTPSLK